MRPISMMAWPFALTLKEETSSTMIPYVVKLPSSRWMFPDDTDGGGVRSIEGRTLVVEGGNGAVVYVNSRRY